MNISLWPEDQQFIQQQLDQGRFRSVDEMIHTALQLLEAQEQKNRASSDTCYELLEQAGVIGMVKGGATDLSTNPRHMEGFGED